MTCEVCCHAPFGPLANPLGNRGKAFFEDQFTNSFVKQTLTCEGQASRAERTSECEQFPPPPPPQKAPGSFPIGLPSALDSQPLLGKGERKRKKEVQAQAAGALTQGDQSQLLPECGKKKSWSVHRGILSLLVSSSLGTHWTLNKD